MPDGAGPPDATSLTFVEDAADHDRMTLVGRIVLGAGTADRLVPDISGDSCQDGAGPPDATSLTFLEDAADHDRMTLVGRIAA